MDNQSKFQFQFIYLARKKICTVIQYITQMIGEINNNRNCIRERIGDIFLVRKFK